MVSIFLLFLFELSDQTVLTTRSYSYLRECVLQGEQRLTNNNNNRQRSRQLTNADIVPILNFQTCILTHLHTTCMYTTPYILHTSDFKSACWQTSGLKTGHSLILSLWVEDTAEVVELHLLSQASKKTLKSVKFARGWLTKFNRDLRRRFLNHSPF